MSQGECERCGMFWFGWSLLHGDNTCDCGGRIIVVEGKDDNMAERQTTEDSEVG